MNTAVVMTVKNEARLLRQNVLYHLGLGVTKIFVYFDNTTDDGLKRLSGLEHVETSNSIKAEKYKDLYYLEKFWSNSDEHHTARQCLNTFDALQKCKAQDIDWLISIDADELFLTCKDGSVSLEHFFEDANKQNASIVNLKPLEVVTQKMAYKHVMLEETLFKTQKNFKSKFDHIYQNIYNPYTKTSKTVSYWLGHTMGKAAVRVSETVIPKNVHRYKSLDGRSLKLVNMGCLLHYHIYDSEDFIKKFKNFKERPATFLSGNKIEDLKSLWIRLVNDSTFSKAYLENYFKENLLCSPKKLKRFHKTRFFNILKRKEPALVDIDFPKRILVSRNKLL
jgi:hypothetical protein